MNARRVIGWLAAGLLLAAASVALCGAAGYARRYVLPITGELSVVNLEPNQAWRPCVVSVMLPDAGARTVTVSRVAGPLTYPISTSYDSGDTRIYEFDAPYWCTLSNGFAVAVVPACTGLVEVVFE